MVYPTIQGTVIEDSPASIYATVHATVVTASEVSPRNDVPLCYVEVDSVAPRSRIDEVTSRDCRAPVEEPVLEEVHDCSLQVRQDLEAAIEGDQADTVLEILNSNQRFSQSILDKSLHLASNKACPRHRIIRTLIEKGADVNAKVAGKTPFQTTMAWVFDIRLQATNSYKSIERHIQIASTLLRNGANPNVKVRINQRPNWTGFENLYDNSSTHELWTLAVILSAGTLIVPRVLYNAIPQMAYPLPMLARSDSTEKKKLAIRMLRSGADPNVTNSRQKPAMKYAIRDRKPDLVKALLDAGADIQNTNCSGSNARTYASKVGGQEIRAMIINHERPNTAV